MVLPLLCLSVQEYYRTVERLGLAEPGVFFCCACMRVLATYGWGERKRLQMRLRRAWCSVCVIRYTIVPVFVAPAKWYSYVEIERALLFVSWCEWRSITAGLKAWEIERHQRIENGAGAGPGTSTVRGWWKALEQTGPGGKWPAQDGLDQAITMIWGGVPGPSEEPTDAAVMPILPEEPWVEDLSAAAVEPPTMAPEPGAPLGKAVLQKLRTLGQALLVQWPAALAVSLLAVGAWFLDGETGHRCLASIDIAGRVIPCRSPSLAVTEQVGRFYPPEAYRPP